MIKKTTLSLVVLLFCAILTFAQKIPTGGTSLISGDITSYGFYGDKAEKTIIDVTQQSFDKAIQVKVSEQPPNNYDMGITFNAAGGINEGDVVLFTFYARSIASIQETGEGFAMVVLEENVKYDKVIGRKISIGTAWQAYYLKGKANMSIPLSEMNIAIQLGFPPQTVQFADFQVINYGSDKTLEDLPETEITYPGRAANAHWRASAKERIEKYRKGSMKVTILDEEGNPMDGLDVKITMQKHKFGFGSAVDAKVFLENKRYHDMVTSLFNEVVFENDLKWNMWHDSKNRDFPKKATEELNQLGISVRGHVLVWPSFRYNAEFLNKFKGDEKGLRKEINNHIKNITSEYTGKLVDWDVLNEPFNNHEFMDIMGYNEMAEWFKLARKQDPDVKLYINDYSILSGGGIDIPHQDDYLDKIRYIDDLGGRIDGIGMQGHFSSQLTGPNKLYEILEKFGSFNKHIKITEFDVNLVDEKLQAEYTRDFMTLVFSHPKVKSLLFWGFWEGRHWRSDAAMFKKDWTAKPNYQAFRKLVYSDWWTSPIEYKSSKVGRIINGFLGTYEISTMYKGKIYKKTVYLEAPLSKKNVFFKLDDETRLDKSILVYPNVQNGVMLVSGIEKNIKKDLRTVTLTDVSGKVMHTQDATLGQRGSLVINYKGDDGMYVLRLLDENENVLYLTRVIKKTE